MNLRHLRQRRDGLGERERSTAATRKRAVSIYRKPGQPEREVQVLIVRGRGRAKRGDRGMRKQGGRMGKKKKVQDFGPVERIKPEFL